MYDNFTQERIAQLRVKRNISARDLSLSLGQNEGYISQIENRHALPSLHGLFYICEYFGITPQEFFDTDNKNPVELSELIDNIKKLDADTLEHINALVKKIVQKK